MSYDDRIRIVFPWCRESHAIDVAGGSTDNGGAVHLWSIHKGDNQQWRLIEQKDRVYAIKNEKSGLFLHIKNQHSDVHGELIQANFEENNNWVLEESKLFPSFFHVKSTLSGLYLSTDGKKLFTDIRRPEQVWNFAYLA